MNTMQSLLLYVRTGEDKLLILERCRRVRSCGVIYVFKSPFLDTWKAILQTGLYINVTPLPFAPFTTPSRAK